MAKFKFTGTETLYFVELLNADGVSFVAVPGETYEIEAQPDDARFVAVDSAPAPAPTETPQTAPEAPSAPSI
jgi:hypothetical protein